MNALNEDINNDDIKLYARGFFGRFQEQAYPMSVQRARELAEFGDSEGEKTWLAVAASVKEIEASAPRWFQ
jgi:hypothetical protein